MARLLITAFRPFGGWEDNASWLALQALTQELPTGFELTTRLYPVDYGELRPRLALDLAAPYDAVLHVGQAAGASAVRLEAFALNARRDATGPSDSYQPLEPSGPAAYRSRLPLAAWAGALREAGVPTEVSLHAGDYLCNAAMYWSHHLIEAAGRTPRVAFVHVPLEVSQVARSGKSAPSLPAETTGQALRMLATWAAADADSAAAVAGGGASGGNA